MKTLKELYLKILIYKAIKILLYMLSFYFLTLGLFFLTKAGLNILSLLKAIYW